MARARPKKHPRGGGIRGTLTRLWFPRTYLLGLAFLTALGSGGGWGAWQNLCAGDACPSIARISTFEHEQKSKILAANGEQIAEFGFESRTPIRISDLPQYVPQSVVAMEDKRFYQHAGFDPIGFARAAVGVLTFNYAGGGSTISQQLARNLFTEIGFEQRYTRKIKELQFTSEEEQKNFERLNELVEKLQHKTRTYKKQIEDAEEIAALNLAKFRKAQQQLEEVRQKS